MSEVLATCARHWLGVRFRHQGRSRDGVDCAGLVACVVRDACPQLAAVVDAAEAVAAGYGRRPDGYTLEASCGRHMQRIEWPPSPGDVGLFRFELDPQHLAIFSDIGGVLHMIHAYAPSRRVVENRVDSVWRQRLVQTYRIG